MKNTDLLDILSRYDGPVSGESLCRSAGVSRTAVWKAVRKLNMHGHIIASSSSRGYTLIHRDDTDDLPLHFRYHPKCSSTNDLARNGHIDGDADGTVYISDIQTKGRGRMGRTWEDQPGRSVLMSVLLRPGISPAAVMGLSLISGLAACKSINKLYGTDCRIKWPNDIILNSRKIGGILIESVSSGETLIYAVAGIGINLNNDNFPAHLAGKASSIFIETGKYNPRIRLAAEISDRLSGYCNDFGACAEEYRKLCLTAGSRVVIEEAGTGIEAYAEDIGDDGSLLVILDDGSRRRILAGEVSVRGIAGYV